jgi:starch synthase
MSDLAAVYVKRNYADDPCLRNAKVICSIYDDAFKSKLNTAMPGKLKSNGVTDKDLALLKNDTGFIPYMKLAIDFSDGIIQGSQQIDPALSEYIASKKSTPFLPYQTEDTYIDAYNQFYDKIMGV